jgi:hypothetical protein
MSQHSAPIVKTILFVADQRHPWKLAELSRLVVTYHTPTTVRLQSGITKHQHQVYCLPDDAAWEKVQAAQANLQAALDELAAGLRTLGSYASRLAAAGGIKTAPNPLSATVISAPDPDTSDEGYWVTGRLVPRIERDLEITSHTPKMLHVARNGKPWSTTHQRDHFVCPDDAAWVATLALIAAANARALDWATLLIELGTYSEALADGRYTKQEEEPMQPSMPAQRTGVRPASSWGATDIDSALVGKLESAGYHWELAKQTPDGRWHHVISARNTALLRNDQTLLRRERLEALLTPATSLTAAQPAGALSTGLQSIARDYIAAREKAGRALLEMASYLALARSVAKHGEWYTFLQATGTSEDQADRLLDIDRKAGENPEYADAVRRNFLSPTTAALLARPSTPAAVVGQVLRQPEPPTKRAVEQQIQAAKPNPAPVRDLKMTPALHPDYQHQAVAEQILAKLDQWEDSARPAQLQEAYGHARQINDLTIRDRLFAHIDRAVEGKPAAPITPESRDAAGPWFWASKSVVHPTAHCWNVRPLPSGVYVAACGLEMPIQPRSGGKGFHCSVCETHADRRQIVPIPGTGPTPITVQTSQGPREVVPLLSNGVIALHLSVAPGGTSTISHVATGRAVAQFDQPASAERAYAQLIALDWQLTADSSTGPVLGLAISRIVTQFDDVDHYDLRKAKLRELEAAALAAVSPIDDLTQRMALSLEAEYGIPVEVEEWPAAAPAPAIEQAPDPRAQIAALLSQIAPLIAGLQTDDQPGLAEAINELNECLEGTEAAHWLNVGWALLDLVPESAVAS